MAKHNSLNELFTATANAIRSKTGGTDPIVADDFPSAIEGIEAGGSGGGGGVDGEFVLCNDSAPKNSLPINSLDNLHLRCPAATVIGQYAFMENGALVAIDLPKVSTIELGAFTDCIHLASVNAPLVTTIEGHVFNKCYELTSIDLPNATSIGEYAFALCINLSSVILRNTNTVCFVNVLALGATNILDTELAPTGKGFVYVPSALFDDYIAMFVRQGTEIGADAATVEYIARAVLRKIEEYPEICGTT